MFKRLNLLLLLIFFAVEVLSAQNVKKIYLFFTNDLHARIGHQKARFLNPNFPPSLGGGASATTIIKSFKAKAQQSGDIVLLFDSGDFLSRTSDLVKNSGGRAMIEYMNKMGYLAAVPGVEDFQVAGQRWDDLAGLAAFPLLACNVKRESDNPFKPYAIIDQNGLKIGVFGVLSQTVQYIDESEQIEGYQFLPELPAARKTVQKLKQEDCDLIIALAHLGLPYDAEEDYQLLKEQDRQNLKKTSFLTSMELAHYVDGIDVLLSGRMHRGYDQPWEDPLTHTLCFQNYARGSNLGAVVLHYDAVHQAIIKYEYLSEKSAMLLLTEDEFWPDPEMAHFIDSLQSVYHADPDSVLGYTLNALVRSSQGESPFNNLMCDAMLEATGADFAFNSYNSLRQNIPIGPITRLDIVDALPFANQLVVVKITGKMLKDLMERSVVGNFMGVAIGGGKVVYDPRKPNGRRIVEVTIGGKPLNPQKMYRVATSSYLAQGNGGMTPLSFLDDQFFEYTTLSVRDAVMQYIKRHSPLKITEDGRWVRK
ncbi:bifunctional metallophosphatase/5'-nucleotidase [Caldithrix abyssi]